MLLAWLLFAVVGAACAQAPRAHIVFLLGADQDATGYFSGAQNYFRDIDPDAQIVTDARSLAQVREELKRGAGGLPWGRIVLVAHGTQWVGLVVQLFDSQTPATLSAIRAARRDTEFPPLPPSVIDADTELVIESCGLGRRPDYLAELAALFIEGPSQLPRIRASRNMVWFGATAQGIAVRRELPYRARILRGKVSAKRSDEVAAKLRSDLVDEISNESAVSILVLPVHVHISARSTQIASAKDIASYIKVMPTGRVDLGGAGLHPDTFVWTYKQRASGIADVSGEATLVLTMQRAPDGASLMPEALDLK